ncbi:hypothetical protein CW304_05035 [Bacillus sp. UFRGS-B20]|nr:hypothetical protein CW304_05035 [Bacillus sp. UFRGS-B20]
MFHFLNYLNCVSFLNVPSLYHSICNFFTFPLTALRLNTGVCLLLLKLFRFIKRSNCVCRLTAYILKMPSRDLLILSNKRGHINTTACIYLLYVHLPLHSFPQRTVRMTKFLSCNVFFIIGKRHF